MSKVEEFIAETKLNDLLFQDDFDDDFDDYFSEDDQV